MGIDVKLYIKGMDKAHLATALAKAVGAPLGLPDNVHSGSSYLKPMLDGQFVEFEAKGYIISILDEHSPLGGMCLLLMARPPEKYIPIFKAVAQTLGGVLVPYDNEDKAFFYADPEVENGHFEVEQGQILGIEPVKREK